MNAQPLPTEAEEMGRPAWSSSLTYPAPPHGFLLTVSQLIVISKTHKQTHHHHSRCHQKPLIRIIRPLLLLRRRRQRLLKHRRMAILISPRERSRPVIVHLLLVRRQVPAVASASASRDGLHGEAVLADGHGRLTAAVAALLAGRGQDGLTVLLVVAAAAAAVVEVVAVRVAVSRARAAPSHVGGGWLLGVGVMTTAAAVPCAEAASAVDVAVYADFLLKLCVGLEIGAVVAPPLLPRAAP